MHDTSLLEIDLDALDHNVRVIRDLIGEDCVLCPIIKADAYGLGAARIAKRLIHEGAGMLAVYSAREACDLIRAALDCPILILMPVREVGRADELYRGLIQGQVHLTVHDEAHLKHLEALSDHFGLRLPLHMEIDTGLCRGGCAIPEARRVVQRIARHRRLHLAGLYTHFAAAEQDGIATARQNVTFERFIEEHRQFIPDDCMFHAANTAAMLRDTRFHKSMVRSGLAWMGCGPELVTGELLPDVESRLRPIVRWTSRIVQIKHVAGGSSVGYRALWTASRSSVLGLVPVGYADGYPQSLACRDREPMPNCVGVTVQTPDGPVRGFAPVVGAISMDQMTIDLTRLVEDERCRVDVGAEVELIGSDRAAPNHLTTLAKDAGVFPHALLAGIHPRVRRVYHAPQPAVHITAAQNQRNANARSQAAS